MKKKKQNNLINALLLLILFVGLSLLLYPTVSDYWNSFHQSKAITSYTQDVTVLENDEYDKILAEAEEYNSELPNRKNQYLLDADQQEQYEQLLNVSGNGIMGYVEIPTIDCMLPIYHGTKESVLQVAVGHLEWTSLPVGGESTHCVVSGHRGLPSARLFTDLDKLREGDIFMLHVLDETFTYEVDQILIVEPDDTDALLVEKGKDYCTLVTCTPYGINSHRLLVRGHRIANLEEEKIIRVSADALPIDTKIVAAIMAVPMLLVWLIILFINDSRKKKLVKRRKRYEKLSESEEDIL